MTSQADTRDTLIDWLELIWQFKLPELIKRDAKIKPGVKAMFSPL